MHILISPNAFKNSASAERAASTILEGLKHSRLHFTAECFPIGDGGDGTADLIVKQCGGHFHHADVRDPLGRKINASFGLIDGGKTAVIEMAHASGLRLLSQDELNPLRALSFGTGQLMKAALDKGATKIVIAMGGSATVDGGTGILSALGVRFLDAAGQQLTDLPESLLDLEAIEVSELDPAVKSCEIIVLCDVDNLLLGPSGSAAVFGPQKGASPAQVTHLDRALRRLSEIVYQQMGVDITSVKYGGTAGGAAAGLCGLIDAELVNGIDYFLELTRFEMALEKSDLLITGEGSIDEQTLQGKGPYGVAKLAKERGIPVVALAGRVPLQPGNSLQNIFDVLLAIGNEPADLSTAISHTIENLKRTATAVGNLLA